MTLVGVMTGEVSPGRMLRTFSGYYGVGFFPIVTDGRKYVRHEKLWYVNDEDCIVNVNASIVVCCGLRNNKVVLLIEGEKYRFTRLPADELNLLRLFAD
jgi:hypothetical protein